MKVLITGIAGFIGFHTASKFHELGHDVVGIDNFNSYYDPKLKYARANILLSSVPVLLPAPQGAVWTVLSVPVRTPVPAAESDHWKDPSA